LRRPTVITLAPAGRAFSFGAKSSASEGDIDLPCLASIPEFLISIL
jgi:hypothetical protein